MWLYSGWHQDQKCKILTQNIYDWQWRRLLKLTQKTCSENRHKILYMSDCDVEVTRRQKTKHWREWSTPNSCHKSCGSLLPWPRSNFCGNVQNDGNRRPSTVRSVWMPPPGGHHWGSTRFVEQQGSILCIHQQFTALLRNSTIVQQHCVTVNRCISMTEGHRSGGGTVLTVSPISLTRWDWDVDKTKYIFEILRMIFFRIFTSIM